jgi:hypothetical protein
MMIFHERRIVLTIFLMAAISILPNSHAMPVSGHDMLASFTTEAMPEFDQEEVDQAEDHLGGEDRPVEYDGYVPRPEEQPMADVQVDTDTIPPATEMPAADPTPGPSNATDTSFDITQAPSLPESLDDGVFKQSGKMKGELAWSKKVMECSRDQPIAQNFCDTADQCVGECDMNDACTHANVEAYPTSGKKYLCKLYAGPRAEYDQSWVYLFRPIPEPKSLERDDEIVCYTKATPAQILDAANVLGAPAPIYTVYSYEQPLHWAQMTALGISGSVLVLLGLARAAGKL